MNNPPIPDKPCPECGGLLLARPKSIRCWTCGAEMDDDLTVTKSGDVEAESAARAAKAEARKARAAAKAAKGAKKRSTAKKPTAKPKAPPETAVETTMPMEG